MSKRQRAFLDLGWSFSVRAFISVVFAKMQPFLDKGSGIYDPTLTLGQSGFVEIWSNSVRFSTFLRTEWEFLHAVFATMRYFCYKKKENECA